MNTESNNLYIKKWETLMVSVPYNRVSKFHHWLYLQIMSFSIIILTISLVACLIYFSNRGFDYSDDAYAYFWARYPFDYKFALRLSGFILHPFEKATQHSLIGLRVIGVALTAASGLLVGIMLLALAPVARGPFVGVANVAAAVCCAFLGTMLWLPTPSYNHVVNWSMALVAAGMIATLNAVASSARRRVGPRALSVNESFRSESNPSTERTYKNHPLFEKLRPTAALHTPQALR